MGDAGDSASDRGRFAAREFLARWTRETGETACAGRIARMLFAYEMGYLRGGCASAEAVSRMIDGVPDTADASTEGKIAAHEFVAYWSRETNEVLSAVLTDRMLFAYEMGYLRGRSDETREAMHMFDEIYDERKETDAEPESE